ncbi:MAG: glycine cleavage system aminomethyltransferase GcvT [Rubellimicrobium sp.]|nr:glycine cleavage system aminomethyltransferase GcvT [Rubellimicrobium sp.]
MSGGTDGQTGGAGTGLMRLGLADLHHELGARMVPFAGYEMPVQYAAGVMAEHLQTRSGASLFDVSHMGQVVLRPTQGMEALGRAVEAMVPVDLLALPEGRQRYGFFTDEAGGLLDDLMVVNRGDHLFVVVNAARAGHDIAHMDAGLGGVAQVIALPDRALLALQGPAAEAALAALVPGIERLRFLEMADAQTIHGGLWIARSGYTGEDGFEISVPQAGAEGLARALLGDPRVMPAGLGARDSLRLEAGLPLYGHDIDTTTSPVEAGLGWAIGRARRAGGARAGGFPGAERILRELAEGPARLRTGLRPEGRAPMREGTVLFHEGAEVGRITSGGFGPSVGAPVAMGYVPAALVAPGTLLEGELRGKRLPVATCPLPFHPTSYKR